MEIISELAKEIKQIITKDERVGDGKELLRRPDSKDLVQQLFLLSQHLLF